MIEIVVVVVILGILAAIALPQFAGATDEARTTATQSTVAGVRSAIASFRTDAVISGEDPLPSLSELTNGLTVRADIPPNPFSGVAGVQSVSRSQANRRAVRNASSAGWNYFVDNSSTPPRAVFYANSSAVTTAADPENQPLTANEL